MVVEVLNPFSGECINTFLTLGMGSVSLSAPALCFPEQRPKYPSPGTAAGPAACAGLVNMWLHSCSVPRWWQSSSWIKHPFPLQLSFVAFSSLSPLPVPPRACPRVTCTRCWMCALPLCPSAVTVRCLSAVPLPQLSPISRQSSETVVSLHISPGPRTVMFLLWCKHMAKLLSACLFLQNKTHWFSAKSRSVSYVTVADISEILRTKGKKCIASILIPKNSISEWLWPKTKTKALTVREKHSPKNGLSSSASNTCIALIEISHLSIIWEML